MRIFLVRHGESIGNIDDKLYLHLQDKNVPLTEWGAEQSFEAGAFIQGWYDQHPELDDKKLRIWHSPFLRATQTKDEFVRALKPDRIECVREDYVLGEQDFGLFSDVPDEKEQERRFPEEFAKFARVRGLSGKFYACPPMGESRMDVALRVRFFSELVLRDSDHGREDIVVIAHGVTNRAFEMNFMHRNVKWFDDEPNPGNCDITLIEGDRENGYIVTRIYQGKLRDASMPHDFKTKKFEEFVPKKPPAHKPQAPKM